MCAKLKWIHASHDVETRSHRETYYSSQYVLCYDKYLWIIRLGEISIFNYWQVVISSIFWAVENGTTMRKWGLAISMNK